MLEISDDSIGKGCGSGKSTHVLSSYLEMCTKRGGKLLTRPHQSKSAIFLTITIPTPYSLALLQEKKKRKKI